MAALETGRSTIEPLEGGRTMVAPVAAGAKIFDGALVVLDASGLAKPAVKAEGLKAAGRAEEFVDNTNGADGALTVEVRRGTFLWDCPATTGKITAAHLLGDCYIADDHTVTATATGSSKAGKVVGVYENGVAVETL